MEPQMQVFKHDKKTSNHGSGIWFTLLCPYIKVNCMIYSLIKVQNDKKKKYNLAGNYFNTQWDVNQ